jgi:hypothetical protein
MFVSDLAIGDNNEPLVSQSNAGAFKRDTIECRFLFENDIANYFDEVKHPTRSGSTSATQDYNYLSPMSAAEAQNEFHLLPGRWSKPQPLAA